MSSAVPEPNPSASHAVGKVKLPVLMLAALGVVFGDIGTSPLYALRECFRDPAVLALTTGNVLGVLSLIFWALILVISLEYMVFVLRADNRGEGGILALMTLVVNSRRKGRAETSTVFMFAGLFGASLLFADAMITPAISVLSAVEGLRVMTPALGTLIVPISCTILFVLYLLQSQGTARIGTVFGPMVLAWFSVLGVLGAVSIVENPEVLAAVNPAYALAFFRENGWAGFIILGTVFLVVTGGEALYADMGHFGKLPIRLVWYLVALPGLLLNYFGQGALLLRGPETVEGLFYQLVPSWGLLPVVLLATAATTIASQAVITGAFSMISQAVNLGLSPRLAIRQTSAQAIGQVYVPSVNYALMVGTLALVLAFQESGALASAYGVAISTTMLATTSLLYFAARHVWGWRRPWALLFILPFLTIEFSFFSANLLKVPSGGWLPLLGGLLIYSLLASWRVGRKLLMDRLAEENFPLDLFLASLGGSGTVRVPGTSVFLTADPTGVPRALLHNLKHNKVLHERVLILTVDTERIPYVDPVDRIRIEPLGAGIFRVHVRYGFHERPDVPAALASADPSVYQYDPMDTTFFLGREVILVCRHPRLPVSRWRRVLFALMARNAQSAAAFFRIPPNRVVELGAQVEI